MHTPHRQLVPKDKLGDEISAEALQAQTAERKNDIPPEKYEILQEIFKLRQLMEMYNDGGIGKLPLAPFACDFTEASQMVQLLCMSLIARRQHVSTRVRQKKTLRTTRLSTAKNMMTILKKLSMLEESC